MKTPVQKFVMALTLASFCLPLQGLRAEETNAPTKPVPVQSDKEQLKADKEKVVQDKKQLQEDRQKYGKDSPQVKQDREQLKADRMKKRQDRKQLHHDRKHRKQRSS